MLGITVIVTVATAAGSLLENSVCTRVLTFLALIQSSRSVTD